MNESLSYVLGTESNGQYQTVLQRFQDTCTRCANNIALVCIQHPADLYGFESQQLDTPEYLTSPYLRWTYHEFRIAVEKLAKALAAQDVQPGTAIFTFLPNGPEFSIILFASILLGATLIPINVRNLENEAEVAHMIDTALHVCSEQHAVVFTGSPEIAAKLDKLGRLKNAQRVLLAHTPWGRWNSFESVMANSKPNQSLPNPAFFKQQDQDSLILFTSGTTSLPKGCHWYHPAIGYTIQTRQELGDRFQTTTEHCSVALAPNNHAMGCGLIATATSTGATLLYPGPTFEPVQFLKAAKAEKVTHTTIVPTMVYALVLAKAAQDIKLEHLNTVRLGGAAVTPEVLSLCVNELGAKGCESAFGMTEGILIMSGRSSIADLTKGDRITVGTVPPDARVKICAPGSKMPLPRGEPGELHGAGPLVRHGYINRVSEDFYDEDGVKWCISGDQARIDEDGRIFILGRYKDMIIRGGENISPVAIEAVLSQNLPSLRNYTVQIVGAEDKIAGEVPVAVVAKEPNAKTVKEIKDTVVAHMGKAYSLDDVIYLGSLGKTEYPRTMAGKVQKKTLKGLVEQYRKEREEANVNGYGIIDPKLTDQITSIWSRLTGVSKSDILPTTPLEDMADSITLMRAEDRIYKQTGVELTVAEMIDAGTIGRLLSMIHSRALKVTGTAPATDSFQLPDRPPTMDDMVHTEDDEGLFEVTKDMIVKAIQPMGLGWDDVRDVMPAYDFTDIMARKNIFARWTFKVAILTKCATVKEAREALVEAVANNPMQASFILWDDDALGDDLVLQFTVDQKRDFIHQLIEDKGSIKTTDELKKTALEMCMVQGTKYPGPLFHAWVYYVEESQSAAIIYNIDHTTTDATFGQLFVEDIDLALSGTPLKPHVPYKLYCDHFYTLRTSPSARAATKYHVQKLQGLATHKAYFFPPINKPLQIEDGKPDGHIHTFSATGINALVRKHPQIGHSLIIKAAQALFLLDITGHTHAIFAQVEGARDAFPFPSKASNLDPKLKASDVGGQLYQSVLNLVSLIPGETNIAFLSRLAADQVQQTRYASAPWKAIMNGLDAESAALFPDYCTSCIYNWLGTINQSADAHTNLKRVDAYIRRDVARFVINASMVKDGKGNDRITIHVRGSVWDVKELEDFARRIERLVGWLVDGESRSVEQFREALHGD